MWLDSLNFNNKCKTIMYCSFRKPLMIWETSAIKAILLKLQSCGNGFYYSLRKSKTIK